MSGTSLDSDIAAGAEAAVVACNDATCGAPIVGGSVVKAFTLSLGKCLPFRFADAHTHLHTRLVNLNVSNGALKSGQAGRAASPRPFVREWPALPQRQRPGNLVEHARC